jgi:hypothetical protein
MYFIFFCVFFDNVGFYERNKCNRFFSSTNVFIRETVQVSLYKKISIEYLETRDLFECFFLIFHKNIGTHNFVQQASHTITIGIALFITKGLYIHIYIYIYFLQQNKRNNLSCSKLFIFLHNL